MLFGLFQGSELKETVTESIKDRPQEWDFDNKNIKNDRIKEIFTALRWQRLYDKTARWDFLGWDRSIRMDKVKKTIQHISAKEKIALLPEIQELVRSKKSVEEQKNKFPLFKTRELQELQNSDSRLYEANFENWKSIKQIEKQHHESAVFVPILTLPKSKIFYLCQVIKKGINGKLSTLSKNDKKILLSLAELYRNYRDQRETLPYRIQDLFKACDDSSMILFAIENSIRCEEAFFTERLNTEILSSLNERSKGNGFQDESGRFVLESLHKLGIHLFSNREYRLIQHQEEEFTETSYISDSRDSLYETLSELSENKNESFSRSIQALLHEDAVHRITGHNAGGLVWKIEQLTRPFLGDKYLSQKFDSERVVTEIHDLGKGNVKIRHVTTGEIQQNPMGMEGPVIGSYRIASTYSIGIDESGNYTIQNLVTEPARLSWKTNRPHPFTSLKADGVDWADLKQLYLDDVNFTYTHNWEDD